MRIISCESIDLNITFISGISLSLLILSLDLSLPITRSGISSSSSLSAIVCCTVLSTSTSIGILIVASTLLSVSRTLLSIARTLLGVARTLLSIPRIRLSVFVVTTTAASQSSKEITKAAAIQTAEETIELTLGLNLLACEPADGGNEVCRKLLGCGSVLEIC